MKENNGIREKAKQFGIKHWQIALRLGVSEQTLVRWLRTPLDHANEQKILCAIDELAAENARVS